MIRRLLHLMLASGLGLAALLLLGASVQAAAPREPAGPSVTFLVNTVFDTPDQSALDNLCLDASGNCSLRAAVQQLDHNFGGIISLPAGTYILTDTAGGDLQLLQNMAIHGLGPGLSVIQGKPGWADRILRVQNGAGVILNSVAISGGSPAAGQVGGGLDVVSGTVVLVDSLVANNQASNGGGIYNAGALFVDHSAIRNNGAYTSGGGIYNGPLVGAGGYLTVSLSDIVDNISNLAGGGVANVGHAVIMSSTIRLNEAIVGGGGLINNMSGTLSIAGSAILANQAAQYVGGGLLAMDITSLTQVANTTVSGNKAANIGGGIAGFGGVVDLFNVTVVSNTANTAGAGSDPGGGGLASAFGGFNVANTLVAQNADGLGLAPDCAGTFGIIGYDLVQNPANCPQFISATTVITGQDPLLQPLGNYGGPTLTYALKLNSPAVDAGDPAGCRFGLPLLVIDQRGQPRKVDGNGDGLARCDIGAFELKPSRLFVPVLWR